MENASACFHPNIRAARHLYPSSYRENSDPILLKNKKWSSTAADKLRELISDQAGDHGNGNDERYVTFRRKSAVGGWGGQTTATWE